MHFFLAGLLIFLLDQASKWWVQTKLPPGYSLPILPPWLHLTHVQNPGAAFGLMAHKTLLLILVTAGAGAVAWIKRKEIAAQSVLFHWGITLALAGAAGNLVDRIRFGRVVDFVDLRVGWVFNLADSCIVVGVALLIWAITRAPEQGGDRACG